MTELQRQPPSGSPLREDDRRLRDRRLMSRRMQLICLWSGLPFLVLAFVGLALSHFLFPPSPTASANVIAHIYRAHADRTRIWLAVAFSGTVFIYSFGGAIAAQTRRIEGLAPVLSYVQLGALGSAPLFFLIPFCCWEAAAFRLARSASEIQVINDIGWAVFTFVGQPYTAWLAAVGLAILSDTSERPIFPRWCGYLSIFVGCDIVVSDVSCLFKHGLLDWRGGLTYWIPFVTWGIWAVVMMVMTTRAIDEEAAIETYAARPPGDALAAY
jgi:hypothetical protein